METVQPPKVDVSFHALKENRVVYHQSVANIGICIGGPIHLAVPLKIFKSDQSIFLRDIGSVPDVMMDGYDEKLVTLETEEDGQYRSIPLTHPRIADWLSDAHDCFVTYHRHAVRITKIKETGQGPCLKQNVVATLFTVKGEVFVGTNRCQNPQTVCPRDVQGMKSGEGYHLCKEVCQQEAHAEVDAVRQAGEKALGAVIHLTGHSYACDNCKSVTSLAGATIKIRPLI